MNRDEQDRIEKLLKQVLPPVDAEAGPIRDLWPVVLRRLDEQQALPWFDLLLAGGLMALGAFFPTAIPVFLYYL